MIDQAPDLRENLPQLLSAARLSTYLDASRHDMSEALALYDWNMHVSAAFMVPLHLAEIAFRNAVADVLAKVHGSAWPWSPGFQNSLRDKGVAGRYSAKSDLLGVSAKAKSVSQVTTELKFAFWEMLLSTSQYQRLWQNHLHLSFSGMKRDSPARDSLKLLQATVRHVRHLRNRIAHHEPIFYRDLEADLERVRALLEWRSPAGARWMQRTETVTPLLQRAPRHSRK